MQVPKKNSEHDTVYNYSCSGAPKIPRAQLLEDALKHDSVVILHVPIAQKALKHNTIALFAVLMLKNDLGHDTAVSFSNSDAQWPWSVEALGRPRAGRDRK